MAGTCAPCTTDDIVSYPIPCRKKEATRKGGISTLLLLKCDSTLIDLTDEAEWSALKTAGKLIVSPKGFGELTQPTTTKEQLDGCSPEVVVDEVSGITFSTKLLDNVNYLDFDFEDDVKNLYDSYTLMWIGCDGLLYYSRAWVTTENPGIYGWVPEVFRTSANNSLQSLNINATFNTYNTSYRGVELPQAVIDAIYA
jgi:hypothetical protein